MKMYRVRYELRLEPAIYVSGRKVLDIRGIYLISRLVKGYSLHRASKELGIPYSRAWEYMRRLEDAFNISIFKYTRGREGISLTDDGRDLIEDILSDLRPHMNFEDANLSRPDLVIVGSDDPLLRNVVNKINEGDYCKVEYNIVGSLIGLYKVLMGEGDLAPIHLNRYGLDLLTTLGVRNIIYRVIGYRRLIGWIYRKDIEFNGVGDLINGKLSIANRVWGSGSRIYLEKLIDEYCKVNNLNGLEARENIRGYEEEYYSHKEAINSILKGFKDVTIGTYMEAKRNGLKFRSLGWEEFNIYIRRDRQEELSSYISIVKNEVERIIASMEGYRMV